MPGPDLHLPDGYRTNPQASADAVGSPFWEHGVEGQDLRFQEPVYRWAAELLGDGDGRLVVDVGCGTAHKLAAHLAPTGAEVVGVDQASATSVAASLFPHLRFVTGDFADAALWAEVAGLEPDLVLSVDVMEHLDDPLALLGQLRALITEERGRVLLSTPDRELVDGNPPLGPPRNPRHVREWSSEELRHLVEDAGFAVVEHRHLLPRRYSVDLAEARRLLGRARRRMALPDQRSCQALLLRRVG